LTMAITLKRQFQNKDTRDLQNEFNVLVGPSMA